MSEEIHIKTAELVVSHNDNILKSGSIGSCIVITLYDTKKRIGGMAHAMLPHRKNKMKNYEVKPTEAKYVDEAVDNLMKGIKDMGGDITALEAKIIGGATMFKKLSGDKFGIGYRNIEKAKKVLQSHKIKIEKEDTGGSNGKMVEFNLANGVIHISTNI